MQAEEDDDVIESDDGPAPSAPLSVSPTPQRGVGSARPQRAAARKKRQHVEVDEEDGGEADPGLCAARRYCSVQGGRCVHSLLWADLMAHMRRRWLARCEIARQTLTRA